jgi:hypothetical protein
MRWNRSPFSIEHPWQQLRRSSVIEQRPLVTCNRHILVRVRSSHNAQTSTCDTRPIVVKLAESRWRLSKDKEVESITREAVRTSLNIDDGLNRSVHLSNVFCLSNDVFVDKDKSKRRERTVSSFGNSLMSTAHVPLIDAASTNDSIMFGVHTCFEISHTSVSRDREQDEHIWWQYLTNNRRRIPIEMQRCRASRF